MRPLRLFVTLSTLSTLVLATACGGSTSSDVGHTSPSGGGPAAGAGGGTAGVGGGGTAGTGGGTAGVGGGPSDCATSSDCAPPDGPCTSCPGAGIECVSAECQGGKCVLVPPTCPSGPCDAQAAMGTGPCPSFLGWAWAGNGCAHLGGCACAGNDCGAIFATEEACIQKYAGMGCKVDPCLGKTCGSPCTTCLPTDLWCPPGAQACDAAGECVSDVPTCSAPTCAADDATAVGPCFLALGFAWDGASCTMLGGCTCEGKDCWKLSASMDACVKAHFNCPCSGKACGEACTCPLGGECEAGPYACDLSGLCQATAVSCPIPP